MSVFSLSHSIQFHVGCPVKKVRVGNSEFACTENLVADNLMKYWTSVNHSKQLFWEYAHEEFYTCVVHVLCNLTTIVTLCGHAAVKWNVGLRNFG